MVRPRIGHSWFGCESKLKSPESVCSIQREGSPFVFKILAVEFGERSTEKQKVLMCVLKKLHILTEDLTIL